MKYKTLPILLFFFITLFQYSKASNRRSRSNKPKAKNSQFNSDNYYTILGLTKKASAKSIKSAYRKLALEYHPDKIKSEDESVKQEAEQIFIKVSEAYSVLSDETLKKIYDKYGKSGLEAHEKGIDPEEAGFGGFPGGGFPGGGGAHSQFNFQGGGAGFDPRKMFESMFGGDDFGFGGAGGGGAHFKVNSDGSGFPGGDGGFPGGGFGGFESMFGGGGGGGGAQGRRRSGSRRQQSREPVELFPKNSPTGIAPLGKAKFPDKSSSFLWIIIFYTNDSPECQSIQSSIETLASKSKGTFKVGAVNCQRSQADERFCHDEGVETFPSFGFVVNGELSLMDQTQSLPSIKAIHEFATSKTPFQNVQMINSPKHVEERLVQPSIMQKKLGSILLLTDKYETSAKYASLAYQFRDKFIFGESRAKTMSIAQHFHVKKYPILIALFPQKNGSEDYDLVRLDNINSKDLQAWVSELLASRGGGSSTNNKRRSRR